MIKVDIQEGQILVNNARVTVNTDSFILVELDCKSKYPQECGVSTNSVAFCASTITLDAEKTDALTEVTLDLPPGFRISATNTGRYSIYIFCHNQKYENLNITPTWFTKRKQDKRERSKNDLGDR